jgi:hypothetical protein
MARPLWAGRQPVGGAFWADACAFVGAPDVRPKQTYVDGFRLPHRMSP